MPLSLPTRIESHRFLILLVALTLLLTSFPLAREGSGATLAFQIAFEVVMVAGLVAMRASRRWVLLGALLIAPAVLTFWLGLLLPDSQLWGSRETQLVGHFTFAAYLFLLVIFVLKDLFSSTEVTNDRLCGALSTYLLLGVAWGFLYTGLEIAAPGSFAVGPGLEPVDPAGIDQRSSTLFYFSFVTLTTLGYGDVTPLGATAQMLAMWEAIVGQAYLTILVARLVGLHVSRSLAQ